MLFPNVAMRIELFLKLLAPFYNNTPRMILKEYGLAPGCLSGKLSAFAIFNFIICFIHYCPRITVTVDRHWLELRPGWPVRRVAQRTQGWPGSNHFPGCVGDVSSVKVC